MCPEKYEILVWMFSSQVVQQRDTFAETSGRSTALFMATEAGVVCVPKSNSILAKQVCKIKKWKVRNTQFSLLPQQIFKKLTVFELVS